MSTSSSGQNRDRWPFPFDHLPTHAWREEAVARAAEIQALSEWVDQLPPDQRGEREAADRKLAAAIQGHTDEVRTAVGKGGPKWFVAGRLARATSNIHAAEAHLLRRAPARYLRGELPNLEAHVRRHLPVDDPRRIRVEDLARKDNNWQLSDYDRESVIGAFRAASSAAAREQMRVRSFSTIVAAASLLLFFIAALVAVLGIWQPTLLALCFEPQQEQEQVLVCPTGEKQLTNADREDLDEAVAATVSSWDVPLIEVVGMVAAGVTGAVALRRLRSSTTALGVPVALNVLKLPTGALTAVLGLLLMRGGFVPGLTALDTTPQIVAWAVVFGASQQLFTGMVDRQGKSVLEDVGGKTYTATGG
jgi:hypothetical protein